MCEAVGHSVVRLVRTPGSVRWLIGAWGPPGGGGN
ncbi:MAG: hypothetical protein Ct9H300mP12_01110 [Acidimicrobiales bacterium]|nr:MAG: hypothetical protein Ct9H300mP12_01110 [Acidimicrobiales bacterium]